MQSSAKRSPRARRSHRLVVSCEHGGNRVPRELAPRFAGAEAVLDSHRGLDYGALEVARALGRRLGVTPFTATTTRLVVDLNRSPGHKNVFSDFTRTLTEAERAATMAKHYWPYRLAVEQAVAAAVSAGRAVVHVASHSFVPVLEGEVRNCDIGLLYDPARRGEVRFIEAWRDALRAAAPELAVRRNYPYRGTSDALVTHLRRRFGERRYAGVELEVNQKHVGTRDWPALLELLARTLGRAL
jgi:predicted N-formylglutamate amidohydrolase